MNTTDNSKHSVDEWNEEISTHLLPDSVILILYLVVGVLGNSVVLYIYRFRFKGSTDDLFFIPALAFADLMTCVIGTSTSFAINLLSVKFYNDGACKMLTFLLMIFSVASIALLLVIAVNRYMKICKPFKKQITVYWKKFILLLIVCASVLISWPCLLFYGTKEIINDRTKTIGQRCTNIRGPWTSIEPLVFKSVLFVVTVVVLLSLMTLYILIGKAVFQHMNYRRNLSAIPASVCSPQDAESSTSASPESTDPSTEDTASDTNRRHTHMDAGQRSEVRLALIFMLITFVFVICYVPKATLMVYESQSENFWTEMNYDEMGGYRFLYTFFYVNNIINPIIYGFFHRRFRREVLSTCCACMGK